MKKILLFALYIVFLSCECPYGGICGDKYEKGYYNAYRNQGYDVLYADMLVGGWQCDYPMVIVGMGEMIGSQPNVRYEMKWIDFINYNKCDITLQQVGDVDRRVYTFSYLYDGNTIRLSKNGKTVILTINWFLYPTLNVIDSYGNYNLQKRKAANC